MAFRLLEQISLAAGGANEDAHAHDGYAALVLDGATPLGPSLLPGPSDAAWIAGFGARRLMAHLKEHGAREALRLTLEDTKKSFEGLTRKPIKERWQIPCAAMMLVVETFSDPLRLSHATTASGLRATGTSPSNASHEGEAGPDSRQLEFFWFGDCAAIVASGDAPAFIVGEGVESRGREAARARIALDAGITPTDRAKVLPLLRAGRGRINSGNNWLFSPEPRAAAHAHHAAHSLATGTKLLLATDGFLALASDYGAYDLDGLMAAAQSKGLAAMGAELRTIEKDDPKAQKFPRFKTHDDATALWLEVI